MPPKLPGSKADKEDKEAFVPKRRSGPPMLEDLKGKHRWRYDQVMVDLAERVLKNYTWTRTGGIKLVGDPESALRGMDLSVPSEERPRRERHHDEGRTHHDDGRIRVHWECPFFHFYWNQSMDRLPTPDDCPQCSAPRGRHDKPSVFERLHRACSPPRQQTPSPQRQRAPSSPHRRPLLRQDQRPPSPPPKRVPPPKRHRQQAHDQHADDSQRRDECHLPRWCPGGLSRPQKHRVQRLRSLKQTEEDYLRLLERFNEISEIPSLRSRRSLVWKHKPQIDPAAGAKDVA